MPVITKSIRFETMGETEVIDITSDVAEAIRGEEVSSGTITVFVPGSTAGVTTIEYESGAVMDYQEALDRLAPRDIHYHHDARWGDGNGYSHVRAALQGASLTVPFASSKLFTWNLATDYRCGFRQPSQIKRDNSSDYGRVSREQPESYPLSFKQILQKNVFCV